VGAEAGGFPGEFALEPDGATESGRHEEPAENFQVQIHLEIAS
jgi:hypothetical protein